jgi:putative ABC transport system permease protein
MAWRNIWRNPRRTLLTISAIAFAGALLVFSLSFQFGSYDAMINTAVMIHTGHLQIQANGYNEKRDMRQVISDPETVGAMLSRIPQVTSYTFRANAFAIAASSERSYGIMVVGIDADREARTSRLKKLVHQGDYLSGSDTNQALIGEMLAKNMHITIGDDITLLGQGRDGSVAATVVRVKGIYRSGQDEFDRSSIHIPLVHFQDVFVMDESVHTVAAICESLNSVSAIKATAASKLDSLSEDRGLVALDWKELMPGLSQSITLDLVSGLIMYVILVLVVAFSILNTFLMAIFERTREFGVMMAIGTTPGRLTALLLFESTIMTLLGVFSGILLGCAVTWYFQIHGIDISGASEILRQFGIPARLHPKLSLRSISIGPAVVLVITFFAALYPALRVRRLRPVEAMNYA